MAYDFLNKTTFTDDLAQQQQMAEYIANAVGTDEDADYDRSDDGNVDGDLVEIAANTPDEEEPQQEQQEQVDPKVDTDYNYDDEEISDDGLDLINSMFAEPSSNPDDQQSTANTGYLKTVASDYSPQAANLEWLKLKSQNVKLAGLNQNISKYLVSLPEDIRSGLVATSGNDQEHTEGSAHYDNRAIDLRYNDKAYNFIKNDPTAQQMGIKMLDPNHGTAPHIHLQTQKYGGTTKPSRYAFGGNTTLFADTEETLRQGLNNNSYDKAVLKLTGENTIRGLDNNQPVAVTDGSKYEILHGKNDVTTMKGNVYETKLKQ